MRTSTKVALASLGFMVGGAIASGYAQSGDTRKLEFEIASVRENRSDEKSTSNFPLNPGPQFGEVGGVLRARNMLLLQYVVFAYQPNSAQIKVLRETMPDWTRGARFDIEAKAAAPAGKDEMRAMMRALLEERFGMRVHREERRELVFYLEVVKPGKLGPKLLLHPADDPECKRRPQAQAVAGGYPHQCGTGALIAPNAPGLTAIAGQNVTMDHFVLGLTGSDETVDRPVLNRTGLPGAYDFTLEWKTAGESSAAESSGGASFADALRDQLGLKLSPNKAAVEFLVVDKVERPTPN